MEGGHTFITDHIKKKKIISDFYSENKIGINYQKIKEKLELKKIKNQYYITHNSDYSYLLRSYFVWNNNLPTLKKGLNLTVVCNSILLSSTLKIYYSSLICKEIENRNGRLGWSFSNDPKLAFPLFKLKGNDLEENYTFERDINKVISLIDEEGNMVEPSSDNLDNYSEELPLPEVWADYIITDSTDLDKREYYLLDNTEVLNSKEGQISLRINNLTKLILVPEDNIISLSTDIYSIKGVIEYEEPRAHFFNEDKGMLEFKLVEDINSNIVAEFDYSRMVNFNFKRRNTEEEVNIIVVSSTLINFSRIR